MRLVSSTAFRKLCIGDAPYLLAMQWVDAIVFYMSAYVRWFVPGGTYFFTVVTERRAPLFADERNRALLRDAIQRCRAIHPFDIAAMVLLPDHLHMVMTLPDEVADFSVRLRWIKSNFTTDYLAAGGDEQHRSASRQSRGARGVWQRRFHEHLCRDETDLGRHVEYIHFNPVKHGHVRCPHDWPHSSFHRWCEEGRYPRAWCCVCSATPQPLPDFAWANDDME